ncbi:Translation initiation factor IF2/IF5 [Corchorus capsularis]|uniref:Translation initiation factor IF2/IF5 n=1 Tax=Corchorus capsularis TaxID=210143 RepID=A0A1R3GBZ4_COCAP|nr:Translation initiation factor IF2/IF5 [Corchorus capsularis]
MSLQNIGAANSDDAFYRYKMPKMQTKIEGRGNGIKTNIVNMVDIAKALARPASYTTKYFGCELGAQSKFDEKTGTCLVNGSHDTAKLAGLLEIFIKKYVQCYGCGNPETEILITKNQVIQLQCAACGFVSDVDMRDKLTSFILKNPPEQKKGSKDKKALRRAEKERLKEEAARQRIQEQLSAVTADMVMLSTNESEKKEKVISKASNKPNGISTPDLHATLVEELKANLRKGVSANQLKSHVGTLSGSDQEKLSALFEALFDGIEKGFAKEVVKKKNYLAAAINQDEGSQLLLLKAIESFCGKVSTTAALKEIALVLKALYDADLLEEEYVLQWYQEGLKGANKDSQIWKNAKPFIEWLQSAESESEEE